MTSQGTGELVMLPSDSIRKVRDLLWRDVITADVFMTPSVPTSGDHYADDMAKVASAELAVNAVNQWLTSQADSTNIH